MEDKRREALSEIARVARDLRDSTRTWVQEEGFEDAREAWKKLDASLNANDDRAFTAAQTKTEEKFLIWDQSEYSGNSVLWWCPNRSGYTTDVDKAGRYTLEEALEIERMRGTDVKVSESVAMEASMKVVDAGQLREVMEKVRAH